MNKVVAGTTARTKNTRRLLKSVLPCTLFNDKFFWQKTCYCIEPRPSLGVLIRRGLLTVAARMPLV